MTIKPFSEKTIGEGARLIASGDVVAFPTETVYGLGADAFNPLGVSKIFDAKNRPSFDPLIVHIAEYSSLVRLCDDMDPDIYSLVRKFWPGPLTVVMKKSSDLPDIVSAGLNTVAVRMPDHPVALELIRKSGTLIAAPSANPFGYISPTRAEHVENQLGDKIPLVIDGGPCRVGVESTIVMKEKEEWYLLRPGGIPQEDIEKVVGPLLEKSSPGENPEAPGQLPWHYSPLTPVERVISMDEMDLTMDDVSFLVFGKGYEEAEHVRNLSPAGDLVEAAANFFSHMHYLDSLKKERIYAQVMPQKGLGKAINNRLEKAAGREEEE